MKTIAFISQKGGVGKTTLALHLAVSWSRQGQKVAILDLDPQASAANWGDRRAEETPVVRAAPPSRLPQEMNLVRDAGGEVVLIDTAPHSDTATVGAAKAADLVIIPCRPSILDLEALSNTIELVQTTNVAVVAILNAVVPHVPDARQTEVAIAELGAEICPVRVSRRVAFSRALLRGLTAEEYEPQGKAAEEIRQLFQVISERVMPQEEQAALAGGSHG